MSYYFLSPKIENITDAQPLFPAILSFLPHLMSPISFLFHLLSHTLLIRIPHLLPLPSPPLFFFSSFFLSLSLIFFSSHLLPKGISYEKNKDHRGQPGVRPVPAGLLHPLCPQHRTDCWSGGRRRGGWVKQRQLMTVISFTLYYRKWVCCNIIGASCNRQLIILVEHGICEVSVKQFMTCLVYYRSWRWGRSEDIYFLNQYSWQWLSVLAFLPLQEVSVLPYCWSKL